MAKQFLQQIVDEFTFMERFERIEEKFIPTLVTHKENHEKLHGNQSAKIRQLRMGFEQTTTVFQGKTYVSLLWLWIFFPSNAYYINMNVWAYYANNKSHYFSVNIIQDFKTFTSRVTRYGHF